jgi:hypothetical protein
MYAAFGVGAVGVIAGTAFVINRSSKSSDADDRYAACERSLDCGPSDIDEIKSLDSSAATSGTLAAIGYLIGAAGIGTGVTLLLLDQPTQQAGGVRIGPWMANSQVGLQGRF